MADRWDSLNLVRKCINRARRPDTDEEMLESDGVTNAWYDLLSEAQDHWVRRIAAIYPEALYGAPVKLTTADGGYTYTFGNDADGQPIFPIGHVELRESRTGRVLIPGADWQDNDFVMEGNKIRIPNGRTKTFTSGPYARFVAPPTNISAAVQPVINPPQARVLIVLRAVITWATNGNLRDPSPWEREEQSQWETIANAYRTQFHLSGAQAIDDDYGEWWKGIDTGEGYQRWNG